MSDKVNTIERSATGLTFPRLAGVAGVCFAVLILLANLLLVPIGLPTPGSSLDQVITFYRAERGLFDLTQSLVPLAWVAATVFGAGALLVLWPHDRARGEAWSLVGFAGLLLQNATFAVLIAVRFALGATAARDDAATAGFWAMHDGLIGLNGTFLALALVGLSVSGVRAGLIRRWHGAAGLLAAILQFSAAVLAPFVVDGAKGLGLIGLAGWLIWVGWFAGYGVALARHPSQRLVR